MDCSMPVSPVLHYLQEFAQIHVHWVHDAMEPSLSSPFSFCLQSFLESGPFPIIWLFSSGGQSTGASASASVLSMNMQGWFPLGFIDLISLQSKGLSGVFSSTTIRKHQFFSAQPSFCQTLTSVHDYWKTIALTIWTFVGKVTSLLFNTLSRFVIALLPRSRHLLIL